MSVKKMTRYRKQGKMKSILLTDLEP